MSKWDWDELIKIVAVLFFATMSGAILAFFGGWLVIRLLYEAFLGDGL